MSSKLTIPGQNRINELQGLEQPLVIDRIILALIPGLDHTEEIDRTQQMPDPGDIVYDYTIPENYKGYVTPDQVVYSIILGSDIGDFSFNWLGTIEQGTDTVMSIIVMPETQKWKTELGSNTTGNIITRSAMMSFQDAQSLTGITIDAQWWQFNFMTLMDSAAASAISDHLLDELDPTDTDETKNKHPSNAQAKVWQDHVSDVVMHETFKFVPGVAVEGQIVNIPDQFKGTPGIIVIPNFGIAYDPAYSTDIQSRECFAKNLEEYNPDTGVTESGTGFWRFTMRSVMFGTAYPNTIVDEASLYHVQSVEYTGGYSSSYLVNSEWTIPTWSDYEVSADLQTDINAVSINSSGNAYCAVTAHDQAGGNLRVAVEVTLEIDGIGSWIIAAGSNVLFVGYGNPTVTVPFSGIVQSFPEGQYTYRYKVRSAIYIYGSGTLSMSLTDLKSIISFPQTDETPLGLTQWYALGIRK